jgi:acetyltransferase-like isoleucine patch superfamily enzyme
LHFLTYRDKKKITFQDPAVAGGGMGKIKDLKIQQALAGGKKAGVRQYKDLIIGREGAWPLIRYELITTASGGLGGALGLYLRSKLFPRLLGGVGRNVFFGRNITLRHPHKIFLGDGVVIDDNCLLDAKGHDNTGIRIGAGSYIGRNSIIYCKNGDIELGDRVNIGVNCTLFSANRLEIDYNTLVAGYTYILSGGEYDYRDPGQKIIDQDGAFSRGPLHIGHDCWIGAGVYVLDGGSIGDESVIGAGSVVRTPIPEKVIALGSPARAIKSRWSTSSPI